MSLTLNEKAEAVSIGLIDNHAIMRMGISTILHEHFEHVRVVEAPSIRKFLEAGNETDVEIILYGINNPARETYLEKVMRFKAVFPNQKLIVYDEQLDFELIISYFKLGINGYVRKNTGEKEMLRCVENVLLGRCHLGHELITAVLAHLAKSIPKVSMPNKLSGRESKIAGYLCQGMKTSVIAQALSCNPSAVSTIKTNILRKMNVSSVAELMTVMLKSPMPL